MFGAMRRRCVLCSPLSLSWLCKKMLWWQICGIVSGRNGVGLQPFKGPLMIGRWRRWKYSSPLSTGKKIRPWIEDKLLLKESSNGNFSVRTMYRGLDLSPKIDFPFRSIWNSMVPSKNSFFTWEASWGKVITLDQLKRRRRALANRCCLYEEEKETIDHLLIHCKIVKMLWDLFLTIVGTNWVFPHCYSHHFSLARSSCG